MHPSIWLVVLPFGIATSILAAPRRWTGFLVYAGAGAIPLAGFALTAAMARNGPLVSMVSLPGTSIEIPFYADGLSAFVILMTAAVFGITTIFARDYLAKRAGYEAVRLRRFWSTWFMLWAGLNTVFLAIHLLVIYLVFEVIGAAAIALIAFAVPDRRATRRYLKIASLGSLCFLVGVVLTYVAFGTLDIRALGELGVTAPDRTGGIALGLLLAGMALKTAPFPLHFWLPPVHAGSPTPVSAVLSAVVVKASFVVLLRLWLIAFERAPLVTAGQLLGAMGCAAILWGSWQALLQRNLKMLVAHSTVGQVGYLFLIFPLTAGISNGIETVPWFDEMWSGMSYQMLSHALSKASLFLCAGAIAARLGSDHMSVINGLSSRIPILTVAIAASGLNLIGLPPSGGFVAKWMILKAVIGSGQWWWLPPIVLGGLLTAAYVFLILHLAFSEQTPTESVEQPSSPIMEYSALALALLAVAMGFRAEESFYLVSIGVY
jgi:multicomponent Na+:H+ antiporter subunit D